MYGRKVSFQLKANSLTEFNRCQEGQIIPILRKQKGFHEVITLVTADKKHVEAISLWEKAEDADAYSRSSFKEVVKLLGNIVEGSPRVETMEVATSTIQRAPAR